MRMIRLPAPEGLNYVACIGMVGGGSLCATSTFLLGPSTISCVVKLWI